MEGGGTFVLVRAAPLPGADDWPMWWHGPDNNAVSHDKAFGLPESVQWAGKPFFGPSRVELPIVSGGRLFMLWNGHEMDSSPGPLVLGDGPEGDGPFLTAQAVGSGARLWVRRLSPAAWGQVSRSMLIGDGARLLVGDGSSILELDAATGRELRRRALDVPEVKWMALCGGRLFVLGGTVTENFGQRSAKAVVPFRSSGLALMALDARTFEPAWRVDRTAGVDAFDPRSPAIDGDKIFLCSEADTAEALSASDGRSLWRRKVDFERMEIQSYEWDRSSRHPVTGYAGLGVYLISGTEMAEAVVVSQDDGRTLWTSPTPGPNMMLPLFFDGLVWPAGQNPLTGEAVKSVGRLDRAGCARITASPQGVLGTCGLAYDWLAAKPVPVLNAKSACGAGQYVANGLAWKFPSVCSNCTEWRGFLVRGPSDAPPAAPPRHVPGGAAATPPAAATAPGWTTQRADARRSASSPARVAATAAVAWEAAPAGGPFAIPPSDGMLFDPDFAPVPPVVSGDTVIVGGADGAVEALDLATGQRRWRAFTGGRIYSSPTVWRDGVLAGSADGYLYALSLSDGRERWRLRVAPETARAMLYGQLGSRWPVLGSPLAVDDRVYAVAGLLDAVDGVRAAAADAATGRLLWDRGDWTAAEVSGDLSGAGQMCWQGAIVYHGGQSPLVRIAAADGAAIAQFGRGNPGAYATRNDLAVTRTTKGQDIGALSKDWIVFGGRRLLTDQRESGDWRLGLAFLFVDASGDGQFPVCWAADTTRMPAWDEREVLIENGARHERAMTLVPQERLQAFLRTAMTGPAKSSAPAEGVPLDDSAPKTPAAAAKEPTLRNVDLSKIEGAVWREPSAKEYLGCALTANAALVLEGGMKGAGGRLVARNRADGKPLWEVAFSARPVYDGLAVAADGRVMVTLVDGRVVCVGARGGQP
jgi:outer membrane protein assembly factor BamB